MLSDWPGFDTFGHSPIPSSNEQYAWSTDQHSLSMSVIACEDGCTVHSDEVHDAIQMMHTYRSTQRHWGSNGWTSGYSAWTLVPAMSLEPGGIMWPVAEPSPGFVQTPVLPAMQDGEILAICKSTHTDSPKPLIRTGEY
jgi:hypothetical protein